MNSSNNVVGAGQNGRQDHSGMSLVMRRLLGILWMLSLLACPVAMIAIMLGTPEGKPYYLQPFPWDMARPRAASVADWLITAHFAVLLIVWISVLVRRLPLGTRFVLCVAVVISAGITLILYFLMCIHAAGINL